MTQHAPQTTALVDVQSLYLHPLNPRQDHDPADIEALARSIAINGLMQNLSGFADPEREGTGIVAGGRRMAALQLLITGAVTVENPATIDFMAIPVTITADPAMALSWAGTEGATQRPLAPADEIRAYAAMANQGETPQAIADAFAQTRGYVLKRLKLATLPEPTMMALRSGRISLETAQALTLCNSAEQHETFLRTATTDRYASPDWIRRQIIADKVPSTERRAAYVGLDLYKLEGGKMEDDLFQDQQLLHDAALLDRLFKEKLTTAADRLKEERGLAQVVPILDRYLPYGRTDKLNPAARQTVELPEADAKELEDLHERGEIEELSDEELARLEELEARELGDYSEDDIAAGTAFIYVDSEGTLKVAELYLPLGKASTDSASDTGASIAAKPPITQTGTEDLHRIERIALQTHMITQPELALDLLAFHLNHELYSWSGPFHIQATEQDAEPSATDEVRIDKRLNERIRTQSSGDIAADFAAFQALGKKHRNAVLATELACLMNAPFGSSINAALMQTLRLTPRSVWTPTAANHFKACQSERLDSIWRELACADDAEDDASMTRFKGLKKAEKCEELEALFNDASTQGALGLSRAQVAAIDAWLPVELRGEE